jgi:hypothetical protein
MSWNHFNTIKLWQVTVLSSSLCITPFRQEGHDKGEEACSELRPNLDGEFQVAVVCVKSWEVPGWLVWRHHIWGLSQEPCYFVAQFKTSLYRDWVNLLVCFYYCHTAGDISAIHKCSSVNVTESVYLKFPVENVNLKYCDHLKLAQAYRSWNGNLS